MLYQIYRGPHNILVPVTRATSFTLCLLSFPVAYSYQLYEIESKNHSEPTLITYPFHAIERLSSNFKIQILPPEKQEILDSLTLKLKEEKKITLGFWLNILVTQSIALGFYALTVFMTSAYVRRASLRISSDAPERQLLVDICRKNVDIERFFGSLDINSPKTLDRALESFRNQEMVFEKVSLLGLKREEKIKVRDLEKSSLAFSFRALRLQLSTINNVDRYKFYYIDMDDLKKQKPLFWYAFHSCVPWGE